MTTQEANAWLTTERLEEINARREGHGWRRLGWAQLVMMISKLDESGERELRGTYGG